MSANLSQNEAVMALMLRRMNDLNALLLDVLSADSRQEFYFRIVNHTLRVCAYERAVLWRMDATKPRILAVSGQPKADPLAPMVMQWQQLILSLNNPATATVLEEASFSQDGKTLWLALQRDCPEHTVLWLPIHSQGRLVGGLWLERPTEPGWGAGDREIMAKATDGYGIAWNRVSGWSRRWEQARTFFTHRAFLMIAVLFVYVMFIHKTPLRVVAPCEIVPSDPTAVCAPLDGVIDRVAVAPGQTVKKGDLLFAYQKDVPLQELSVLRQQVMVMEARLERADFLAFDDETVRARIGELRLSLAQERLRLKLARLQAEKLEVRAPHDGVIMVRSPHDWRGKSVRVGERVLMVFDPACTRVNIWVAQNDDVRFNRATPVKVVLNAAPTARLRARILHVAFNVQAGPDKVPAFLVEAEWIGQHPDQRVGLKGTSVLYGEPVSLCYYLLRKPLAWVRRFTGF